MSSLDVLDETRERGVQNPRVIDLIRPEDGSVAIAFFESRSWEESNERRDELAEKFNNYLDYILGGFFAEQYPQYEGKPVELVFQCPGDEMGTYEVVLQPMRDYAASCSLELRIEALQETH